MFWKYAAYLQENTHAEVKLRHECSPVNLLQFLEHLSLRTPQGGCFWTVALYKKRSASSFLLVLYELQKFIYVVISYAAFVHQTKNLCQTEKRASVLRIWIFEWKNTSWIMMALNEMLFIRLILKCWSLNRMNHKNTLLFVVSIFKGRGHFSMLFKTCQENLSVMFLKFKTVNQPLWIHLYQRRIQNPVKHLIWKF